MIQWLKDQVNSFRQNFQSAQRKQQLSRETDPLKVKHLHPTVTVPHKWYGSSYGGFFIAPHLVPKDGIIYSVGIGKDISFDLDCLKNHDVTIFAFDPTPKSIDWLKRQNIDSKFRFEEIGLSANISGPVTFYLPANPKGTSGSLIATEAVSTDNAMTVQMKTLNDITSHHHHDHIHVLKMDIEGAEYDVLEAVVKSPVVIDQILVEFHDRLFDTNEFRSAQTVKMMKENGYSIFATSISFEEISFIRDSILK